MTIPLTTSGESVAYEAKEVLLLLSKEIVKLAFAETEKRIVTEWRKASTIEEREFARTKLDAFETWKTELRALAERHSR